MLFGTTNLYCASVPLALNAGVPAAGKKHQILLFEHKDDYIQAGGPPRSGGIFISGKNLVMIPLESLGVRPLGSGYTPYRAGSFNVRGNLDPIIQYVTAYGKDDSAGRGLGTKISLPSLKKFMLLSSTSFPDDTQLNYGGSLLLTTYFLTMDGDGSGTRVKAFLQALRDKKQGEEALAALLDGRSCEQVEDEITKAWGPQGDFVESRRLQTPMIRQKSQIQPSRPAGRLTGDPDSTTTGL